ncbi:MAG: hypothetical protein EHM20_02310 [Alphaproteobacteria bacterium]|nr:MAG: hypothetical protein EHM20_02310 [Alphaproteobacteria bacterium]
MKMIYWILGIAVIGLSISIFFKLYLNETDFELCEPSFKRVKSFTRPVVFLGIGICSNRNSENAKLYYLDKQNGDIFSGPVVNSVPKKSIFNVGIIGVLPNSSSFFVSVSDELVEFDLDLKVKRRIPIGEFNFDSNEYYFEYKGFGKASENYLWFGIRKIREEKSFEVYKSFLAEWDFNELPSTRILSGEGAWDGITVDDKNHIVFGYDRPNQIYNFKTMENGKAPYSKFDFADYDPNYGLLLSKSILESPGQQSFIVKLDPLTGKQVAITEGLSAVWGYDGTIYYCDTRRRLWRCSEDGNDATLLSSGMHDSINANVKIFPPIISYDRTMLAYNYSHGIFPKTEISGTVLIDLKNHEYMILDGQNFAYNRMAWLIKDSETLNKSD